ncbi:glycosyltransferase [Rhodopseudomonas palustris]|uniref:glycosyltransferase n=1 Tax=Rhodopseudomonas palustris TaxID=1076 RepID=UPI0005A20677
MLLPYRTVASFGYDLPNGLVAAWLSCGPAFQLEYDIENDAGADDLVHWWMKVGRALFPGIQFALDRCLATALHLQDLGRMVEAQQLGLTKLLSLILRHREDLRKAFDVSTPEGIAGVWYWWMTDGQRELLGAPDWLTVAQFEALHSCDLRAFPESGPVRPTLLATMVWQRNELLQATFDLHTPEGIAESWRVLLDSEASVLRLPDGGMPRIVHGMLPAAADAGGADDRFAAIFPDSMAIFYSARRDLQVNFDITTGQGVGDFVYWWLLYGRADAPQYADAVDSKLATALHLRHLAGMSASGRLALTPLLALIHARREELQRLFDVSTPEGIAGVWYWWMTEGQRELLGAPDWLTTAQFEALHSCDLQTSPGSALVRPTLLVALVWQRNEQLRSSFDLDTPEGLAEGWRYLIEVEAPLLGLPDGGMPRNKRDTAQIAKTYGITPELALDRGTIAPLRSRLGAGAGDRAAEPDAAAASAVALVGYPRGEFGLGEDIRLLRAALQAVGVAPSVIRAPWQIVAREGIDEPAIEAALAEFRSDVMFYVMPAFDTVTLMNTVGSRAFQAKRRIGFWQWELDRFPHAASFALNLVDEIWCHSEHSARAFRSATDKPVTKVPLPINVPETGVANRADYGLPDSALVIFTSFDGASSISRKNPLGAIEAFQRAFDPCERNVRLLVKAMNVEKDALWRECLRRRASDDRIVILDEVMDRNAYYELLRACDVVLSMHRAEGFGRLMAEAMALGIPAIASGYSGNVDFMTKDNSWLVEGRLLPVLRGDYAFYQAQHWFEPDVDSAAAALRECFEQPELRHSRGQAGQRTILENYSLEACGRVYSELLRSRMNQNRTSEL